MILKISIGGISGDAEATEKHFCIILMDISQNLNIVYRGDNKSQKEVPS